MKNQELSEKQKPILSEKEAEIIKESIVKTFSLIEEGKAQLSNHDDEKVLLVIGKTGVGKSTLINYLSGAELVATKKGFGGYVLNVKEQVGNIKIGHSNVSETTVPNKWYDEKTGITYWDCPGFEDTKGAEQDIANAFYVQRLFNNPKLKLVVVVQETTFMEDRGSKFIDLIGKLGILLKDFNKFKDGLSLVVTKASPSMTTEDVKYGIGTYLEEVKNLSFVQKEILQFLSGKDGKVELFTTPREPGPISGEMRDKMLWMINNTKYVDKSEVNITVSDKSLLVVEEMAKNVNIMVSDSVRKICFNLENIYQKDIEQLKNANGNISKIKDSLQSLNIWNSLIQELVIKSDQANSTEEFVRQLDEKISANKIISEEKFKGLQEYLSYLDFFKTIHKSTEKSLKLKEWIKNFQDISEIFEIRMKSIIEDIKSDLEKYIELSKEIFLSLDRYWMNKINAQEINAYKNYNDYINLFKELDNFKIFSNVLDYLENKIIKPLDINVNINDLILADNFSRLLNVSSFEEKLLNTLKAAVQEAIIKYEYNLNDFYVIISKELSEECIVILDKILSSCKKESNIPKLNEFKKTLQEKILSKSENISLIQLIEILKDNSLNSIDGRFEKIKSKINELTGLNDIDRSLKLVLEKSIDKIKNFNETELPIIYQNLLNKQVKEIHSKLTNQLENFTNQITLSVIDKKQIFNLLKVFNIYNNEFDSSNTIVNAATNLKIYLQNHNLTSFNLDEIISDACKILELSPDSQYLSKTPLDNKIQILTSQFSLLYSEKIQKESIYAITNFVEQAELNLKNKEKLNNNPFFLFNLISGIIQDIDSIKYHKAQNVKDLISALMNLGKCNNYFSSLSYNFLEVLKEEDVVVNTQMITPLIKFEKVINDLKQHYEDQKKKHLFETILTFDKELKIFLDNYEKTNNDIDKQIAVIYNLKNNFCKNQIAKLKTVNEVVNYLIQIVSEQPYLSKISNNALIKAKEDYSTDTSDLIDKINSLEQYLSQKLDGFINKKTIQEAIIIFSEFKDQVKQSLTKLEDQLNNDNKVADCHSIAFKLKQDFSLMQLYDHETIGQLATYLISVFDKYKIYLSTTTKTKLEKIKDSQISNDSNIWNNMKLLSEGCDNHYTKCEAYKQKLKEKICNEITQFMTNIADDLLSYQNNLVKLKTNTQITDLKSFGQVINDIYSSFFKEGNFINCFNIIKSNITQKFNINKLYEYEIQSRINLLNSLGMTDKSSDQLILKTRALFQPFIEKIDGLIADSLYNSKKYDEAIEYYDKAYVKKYDQVYKNSKCKAIICKTQDSIKDSINSLVKKIRSDFITSLKYLNDIDYKQNYIKNIETKKDELALYKKNSISASILINEIKKFALAANSNFDVNISNTNVDIDSTGISLDNLISISFKPNYSNIKKDYLNNLTNYYISDSYGSGKIFSGKEIKLSYIKGNLSCNDGNRGIVKIKAFETFIIDCDLTAKEYSFYIVAPKWVVNGKYTIDISGNNGHSYYTRASDGSDSGYSGSNGNPGGCGKTSGSFFGVGNYFSNINKLTLIANGGSGGRGQDGGNGRDGKDGNDATGVSRSNYDSSSIYTKGVFWNDVLYTKYGTNGQSGGNGGQGGKGGDWGYAGHCIIFNKHNKSTPCTVYAQNGSSGSDGSSGNYGCGGKNGRHKKDIFYQFSEKWSGEWYVDPSSYRASSGCNASGTNSTGRQIESNIDNSVHKIRFNETYKEYIKDLDFINDEIYKSIATIGCDSNFDI